MNCPQRECTKGRHSDLCLCVSVKIRLKPALAEVFTVIKKNKLKKQTCFCF